MNIFESKNYVDYLQHALTDNGRRAGAKLALAKYLRCQSSFVSQVLSGRSHFSPEHAVQVSDFLKHSHDEREFFLLLVQHDRAGSFRLKQHYHHQLQDLRLKREEIGGRLALKETIKENFLPQYYSMWWYSAIHVLTAFPQFSDEQAISARLNLPLDETTRALQFLVNAGLVATVDGGYKMTQRRIHLDRQSPLIHRHHGNWRMKAAQACERAGREDLRYSAILGLSEKDALRVKELFLELLAKSEKILKESEEQDAFVMLCDFFRL